MRSSTYATVEALLDTGLPVWLSFRRCRHGVCGVYGEHWGGPEGDAFGRAARRFEEMGIGALAINCLPPDHVTGMLAWLRDFTDLPLGVYPNLGYLSAAGWRHEAGVGAREYAELALRWREEGAQIVGGCCGVGPEQIAAARTALNDTKPGHARHDVLPDPGPNAISTDRARPPATRWTDSRGRLMYPLDFPDITVEPGVFAPTQGSFLVWKYLYHEGIGAHQRCLDIGSGTGLLTVQLARNGAAHVHGIDIDPAAVKNTHGKCIPKRRGRPRERGRAGSLPLGPRGTLRRDCGQPLPDPGGSVRAGRVAPAARLLGAGTSSTTCCGCCRRRSRTTAPHT